MQHKPKKNESTINTAVQIVTKENTVIVKWGDAGEMWAQALERL